MFVDNVNVCCFITINYTDTSQRRAAPEIPMQCTRNYKINFK